MTLRLADALKVVEGAINRARELDTRISVTVCDATGRLIALHCMDEVFAEANRGSIGRAIAVVASGRSSKESGISADFGYWGGGSNHPTAGRFTSISKWRADGSLWRQRLRRRQAQ